MPAPGTPVVGAYSQGTGPRDPGVPAGVDNGVYVMLVLGIVSNVVPAVPSGFANKFNGNGATPTLVLHHKKATGPESGTYASVASGTVGTSGMIAVAVDGEDTATDPIGTLWNQVAAGSQVATASVSLTDVPADSLLIWAVVGSAARTLNPPTGFTRLTANASQNLHVAYMQMPAGGSTGAITTNFSSATANRAGLWAIKGASGASLILPDTVIGGTKRQITARKTVINQTFRSVTAQAPVINQTKKTIL